MKNNRRVYWALKSGIILVVLALSSMSTAIAGDVDYAAYGSELRHKKQQPVAETDAKALGQSAAVGVQVQETKIEKKTETKIAPAPVAKTVTQASAASPQAPESSLTTKDVKTETVKPVETPKKTEPKAAPKKVESAAADDDWMVKPGDKTRNAPTDKLARKLRIDQVLKEAKAAKIAASFQTADRGSNVKGFNALTDTEIINSLVKEDLLKTKVDLDFGETSLGDLFMTLGKAGNINIMVDPLIKDLMIDIYLKQVTIKEALLLIANAHNLGFKRIESALFVTSKDKLREQSIGYKIIKLRNIKAMEAKNFVAELARIVNVSEQINSLIVIGQPDEIAKVQEVIQTIDTPQPQVILEANIVEVNKDALKDLGVDWSDEISFTYQESGRPLTIPNVAEASKSTFEIGAIERSPLTFATAIKILENQNKAKVLSNPRVTTMNEKEAEIFVGDRIPYTVNTISGGATSTEVRFEEPGIRLRITPMIIDGDFVVIKVEPEVSFIFAFRGPENEFPWTKKRQATAYVRVRNNQPFVLGGLLNQEDKKNLFKVPMIGNLPLVGNLFTYEKHSVLDTELIITVTPIIVQGAE